MVARLLFYWNGLLMEYTHKQAISISNARIFDFLWWWFSVLTGNYSESGRRGRSYLSVFFLRLLVLNNFFCSWSLGCHRFSGFIPCSQQALFVLWTSCIHGRVFLLIVLPSNSSTYPILRYVSRLRTLVCLHSHFCLWVISWFLIFIFPAPSYLTFQVLGLQACDIPTHGLFDAEDKTQNLMYAR